MNISLVPRTFTRLVASLIVALAVALFSGVDAQEDPAVIEVGTGQVITESEFEQEFQRAVRSLAAQQGIPYNEETRAMFDRFRADFLNQLAIQEALLQEAGARGIEVTDEEVEQQISQAREQLGGEEQFQQALQDLGYESVDAFRENVRKSLLAQRTADEIRAGIEVTDEDVRGFFDESQDLFGDAPFEQVQEQARAGLVNQRLTEEFTALQQQYAIEAFPERVTALDDAEEGVAGGGAGFEDEADAEAAEEDVVGGRDTELDMDDDPEVQRDIDRDVAVDDDETGADEDAEVGAEDEGGAEDEAGDEGEDDDR